MKRQMRQGKAPPRYAAFRHCTGNQKRAIWVKLGLLYDAGEYNRLYIERLMMARALACFGDKTSYGEIISETASWFEESKAIARTGDKASCSKCNGYFEILASAQEWAEEGKAYAATGDRVLYRCLTHLFTVQPHRLPAQALAL